jgi:hypothetical protein
LADMSDDRQEIGFKEFTAQSDSARKKHGLIFDNKPDYYGDVMISVADLRDLALMQNIFYPTKFTSHRRFIGWFIVFIKELAVRALDPYLRRRLSRQFEINQFTWNLALNIRKQNEQIFVLKSRIENLEVRLTK